MTEDDDQEMETNSRSVIRKSRLAVLVGRTEVDPGANRMRSITANQEPELLTCLADQYGHPHWERRTDIGMVGVERVSAAPSADQYGHCRGEFLPGIDPMHSQ